MIDLKLLKERREKIKENIKNRRMKVDVDEVIKLGDERLDFLSKVEKLRNRRNEVAANMKQKLEDIKRKALIEEGKKLKDDIAELEQKLENVEKLYYDSAKKIPNFSDEDAPVGSEDEGAVIEIKKVGTPRVFNFKPLDHVELGKKNDLIDFETATKVSGNKFYYLKNEAVMLELALSQFAITVAVKH